MFGFILDRITDSTPTDRNLMNNVGENVSPVRIISVYHLFKAAIIAGYGYLTF